MIDKRMSRRRFLVAAISGSGLVSTGMGVAFLRASLAWAQSGEEKSGVLAQMARLLFPHDAISDDVYAEVIDSILAVASTDSSLTKMLDDASATLNAAQGGDWFDADESEQMTTMQSIEGETFFNAILDNVRVRFYNHAKVWQHLGYPGSSLEFGGYIDRGFDDIDWLQEDA